MDMPFGKCKKSGIGVLRRPRPRLAALCACLLQILLVSPGHSIAGIVDDFKAIKPDEVPANLLIYLNDRGDGRYKYKKVGEGGQGRIFAIRIISSECDGDFCPTYFEYQGDGKNAIIVRCAERMIEHEPRAWNGQIIHAI